MELFLIVCLAIAFGAFIGGLFVNQQYEQRNPDEYE